MSGTRALARPRPYQRREGGFHPGAAFRSFEPPRRSTRRPQRSRPLSSERRRRNAEDNKSSDEPPPGHTRKETEGVFLVRDNKAVFTPVKIGIAGEKYFEVLDGLKTGDRVITGPFANVRGLTDGEEIRLQEEPRNRRTGTTTDGRTQDESTSRK